MLTPTMHDTLRSHYKPNSRLAEAGGLAAYNCGYAQAPSPGAAPAPFADLQRELVWRLLADTPVRPGAVILDVGSGIGGPATWMAQRFPHARVFGLEFLAESVRTAHRLAQAGDAADAPDAAEAPGSPPAFIQADAQKLPVASASVDIIFNLESALHYPDKAAFLRECARVLRPGGRLCLGDITAPRKFLFAPVAWLDQRSSLFNTSVRLASAADYRALLAETGFQTLRHEDASQPVARALGVGLHEIGQRGWRAAGGFRGRLVYLAGLRLMLRGGLLSYDLFNADLPGTATRDETGWHARPV